MSDEQTQDVYFSTKYVDSHRKLTTERVYYTDGRVRVYDGKEWKIVHCLSPDQVQQLQFAIESCGVMTGEDIPKGDAYDTAVLRWRWNINGNSGELVNYAYPAFKHPAMDCGYEKLREIEAAAKPCE